MLYAGNVGFSQSLELVLAAARELPDVTFLVNGNGAARVVNMLSYGIAAYAHAADVAGRCAPEAVIDVSYPVASDCR